MRDLIDRQAALNEAYTIVIDGEVFRVVQVETLEGLPSAQPEIDEWCTDCREYDNEKHCCPRYNRVIREALSERKTGRWEYVDYGGFGNWHCTACREICICNGDYDFCPNCGADMRGGVDGADGNG